MKYTSFPLTFASICLLIGTSAALAVPIGIVPEKNAGPIECDGCKWLVGKVQTYLKNSEQRIDNLTETALETNICSHIPSKDSALCDALVEKYVPVEHLKRGTLVKTSLDGYKPVVLVGKGTIHNAGNEERTENRLYKCSPSKYPQLKEDLYITGAHAILESPISDKQREAIIKYQGRMYVTDKKCRVMACLDERAEPWNSEGTYTIYHFALENKDEKMNYGVYANGGLLVETCSINSLKNKSNMSLLQ